MNTFQNNTAETKSNFPNPNGKKNDRSAPGSTSGNFSNDQKFRNNESKKKINRFFAGLPFNPEP